MTWRQIALKNILFNARRYFGYLGSSAAAVMVFFMFSGFTMNPHVKDGYMSMNARYVLGGCQYIVVAFAMSFILFFHAALIRARSREFALFRVLGMTPWQVWRAVFAESILLGMAAIAAGMVLGTLFLKLFLMAMGTLLDLPDPIPFALPVQAVVWTVVIFGAVFFVEGAITAARTAVRTPKSLMLAARTRQKVGKASWWLVLLGVAAIAAAYYMAIAESLRIIFNFFPIIALTALGTHLLYSQISVKILNAVRRRPLRGVAVLAIARFAHRLKDNARVFTVVTLLTAMVLSGMGSVFGLKSIVNQNSVHVDPFAVMLVEPRGRSLPLTAADVQHRLNASGTPVSSQLTVPVSVATIQETAEPDKAYKTRVTVISASQFDRVRRHLMNVEPKTREFLSDAPPAPAVGHAKLFVAYPLVVDTLFPDRHVRILDRPGMQLTVDGQFDVRIFNEQISGGMPDFVLEVADADYAKLSAALPSTAKYQVTGFTVPDWKHSLNAVLNIQDQLAKSDQKFLTARISMDVQMRQWLSTMMFAGFFVSLLFFLACATAIYFRLQSQSEGDKRQFFSLRRIGVQDGELGRLLTLEMSLLFFTPVIVGLVHSTVAMIDFSHLVTIKGTVWPVYPMVSAIYVACTALFFAVARMRYMRQVAPKTSLVTTRSLSPQHTM